ncbi:uncharacterized protein UTRI_00924 [Ustilago trichophora]|uniref:Uncharacterized protein n=1 Tax=Ustilago trichophora TaxID=86804 RepID=A0A5C3DVN3_9BASI|nr:uncharacterized protein UTRI_00924 [Ustilago trichophora]
MQQVSDPARTAKFLIKLHARIHKFLSDLGVMRPNLQSLFSNLSTASLEPQEARDHIVKALDKIASDDACAPDEAVTYLILLLPALNSSLDASEDNRELEDHFAQQLCVNRHFTKWAKGDQIFDSYLQATSIMQSSGTGKTWLVLELGKKAPLLYICVHCKEPHVRPSVKQGFPLAEQNLYKFFEGANKNPNASPNLQVAIFLTAWFETLHLELEKRATAQQKYEFLAQLNDYGGPGITKRQLFFETVIATAHIKLLSASASASTATSGASAAAADVFAHYLDEAVCNLGAQLGLVRGWLWQQHAAYYKALGIDCPPIFVAFDECIELIVPNNSTESSTNTSSSTTAPFCKPNDHQLISLRRAWHHLLELQRQKHTDTFWLILLSTNTGAAELIRPQNMQGAARAEGMPLLPIFVGLGFDVLRAEQLQFTSPSNVSAMHHVRSYGRPLWASLPPETFWRVAKFKLLGARPFSSIDPVVCYNQLASRLALQFISTHRGDSALFGVQNSLITQSVDRHMRILQQVIDHLSLVISAPSEPVLAIAATLIMLADASEHSNHSSRLPLNYTKVIGTFTSQCLPRLGPDFLRGAHGEFMARFAMMTAWDAVKLGLLQSERYEDQRNAASIVSEPVPLQAFLEQLAMLDASSMSVVADAIDDVCSTVRKRLACHKPSSPGAPGKNNNKKDDEEDDVGAWLNFTHVDTLPGGISCISPDYLWYCWKRGVALQMAHGQAGVNGIIPVFVSKLSQRFRAPVCGSIDADASMDVSANEADEIDEAQAARQMSYIAWEAKYRDEAMSDAEARKPSRAGPTLLPAACDVNSGAETEAETSGCRPEMAPLTRAGLVTVLADLGTRQAFAADRSLAPRADIVGANGDKSAFSPAHEADNKNASPVWRSGAHPEIRSRVQEGPTQSWHWSSPSMPAVAVAAEDNDDIDEPMEI